MNPHRPARTSRKHDEAEPGGLGKDDEMKKKTDANKLTTKFRPGSRFSTVFEFDRMTGGMTIEYVSDPNGQAMYLTASEVEELR